MVINTGDSHFDLYGRIIYRALLDSKSKSLSKSVVHDARQFLYSAEPTAAEHFGIPRPDLKYLESLADEIEATRWQKIISGKKARSR